jgi:tetratricopeptide (TPR) repeat protein
LGASLLGTTGIALQGVSTNSTAAFDLYLKALEQQATASYGSLGTAEGLLKNALATDPGFIEAKYALIRNYMAKRRTGLIDQPTALQSIEPLVQQVKAERPQDPLPRAFELIVDSSDLNNLARGVKRDVIINEILTLLPRIPSDTFVREVVAMHLRRNNAFEEALGVLKAGLMLDPLSTNLHHELSHLYLEMERYEDAQSTLMRGIEIAPDFPAFYSDLSDLARETGDINAALNWKRKGIEKDPQDHELAAELASTLFLLGLTEEGARWADRCYALAAHTTVCRLTQLEQASANHDEARRLLLAESMLRDNVDTRRGGFHRALVSYADLMTEKGQAREAWDFLKSTFPGMDAHGQPPESMKLLDVRRSGVELMAWFEPADRFNSALDQLIETERTANPRWLGSTRYRLENHLLRGEIDQALTIALEEDLNQVITMMLDYRHRYATPLYRELSQIPEVAAQLREIDAETRALSEQVRVAMLEPEWNQ